MTSLQSHDIKHITEMEIYRGQDKAGVLRRTDQGCELELADQFMSNSPFNELS